MYYALHERWATRYKYDSRGTCYIGKDAYKKAEKDQKEEKDKTS